VSGFFFDFGRLLLSCVVPFSYKDLTGGKFFRVFLGVDQMDGS